MTARRVRQRGMSPFTAGLIALVVTLVACFFGFTKTNPFASPLEFQAAFRTANDLKPKSPVRVAGVNIGTVTKVEPLDGPKSGSIVTMKINDRGLPLHEDMRLKIRPRIFLEGNWFIDVSPGSPSAPEIEDGHMVPVQQTAAPVQFGEILTSLQSDTRQDLQIVLDEYGRALANGGARGYNRSIPYWKSAFRDSAIVNEATLGKEEHDLTGYIRGVDRFARGLDRSPEQLKALITDLAVTADALASEGTNLTAAIAELPRTLTAGRSALAELNTAFPPLRRFVADLRPAVRSSGPALDATRPLIRQLRGLVRQSELKGFAADLRKVIPDLAELNKGGIELQRQLRLLSSCTNEVINPWRESTVGDPSFPASGPVYEEQVKWMPGIAAESRNFDANGQYVRSAPNGFNYAYALNNERFFFSGVPLEGVNPPKVLGIPPIRPDVPCETQQNPDLRSNPSAPPAPRKVNHDAPGAAAKREKSKKAAIRWLRRDLKRLGLKYKVSDEDLSRAALDQLSSGFKKTGTTP